MKTPILRSAPDVPAIALCCLAATWCGGLWLARFLATGTGQYFYLLYNLSLAVIPLILSTLALRTRLRWLVCVILTLWLAFFPNAPYLITDLIHLRPKNDAPFWFDWLFMVSCAGAGFLVACVSLRQVQATLCRFWGRLASAFAIGATLCLTGFGIYLGRFPRWNSWDIVAQPGEFFGFLAEMALNPLDHPRMLAYSFGVTIMLGFGYLACLVVPRVATPAGE